MPLSGTWTGLYGFTLLTRVGELDDDDTSAVGEDDGEQSERNLLVQPDREDGLAFECTAGLDLLDPLEPLGVRGRIEHLVRLHGEVVFERGGVPALGPGPHNQLEVDRTGDVNARAAGLNDLAVAGVVAYPVVSIQDEDKTVARGVAPRTERLQKV